MFDSVYSMVGAGFTVLVVAFVFLKGDEPERVGAGAYVLGFLASLLIQDEGVRVGPQWGLMAVDLVMLAVYVGLSWRSRRAWPAWASGLQALIMTSHFFMLVDLRTPLQSFFAVISLASYGILIVLAIGAFWAWQERRAAGLE